MDRRPTYLLVIIFLALAGWVWFQKNQATTIPGSDLPTQEVVPTLEYLFPAEKGVVTSMLIQNRAGEYVSIKRVGTGWRLTAPIDAEADAGAVEAAASQLTSIPVQTRLPDLPDADAGLAAPAFTLTISFSDGTSIIAYIGDETPTGSGYYARKSDGEVIVISTGGINTLTAMLDNLPLPPTATPTLTPSPLPVTETPQPAATETPTATKVP